MNAQGIVEKSEVTLLDLLVVIAENLKLLVLGPLVTGVVAYAITYALPLKFTSQAILALPTDRSSLSIPAVAAAPLVSRAAALEAATTMVSPIVLDAVVASLNLNDGRPVQVARDELAQRIKTTVGKDDLLRLDVTAGAPAKAQLIASAVIDSWLKSTVPAESDRADLETRLVVAKTSLDSVRRLLEILAVDGPASLTSPPTRGASGPLIVAVGELQKRYLDEVLTIPRLLRGVPRDVVKQSPSLPAEPVAPRKGLIAVLSASVGAFVLTLWVALRQAWKSAAQNPEGARKQARVRAALRLGGHGTPTP